MTFLIVLLCIGLLILLIVGARFNAFIAFLIVCVLAGILLGLPLTGIVQSVNKGIGDTLGKLVITIVLGAMLGKLVAESGAAKKIAAVLIKIFGKKYIAWAMVLAGFVIGIPLFYSVGFVLVIPLIFSVVYESKLPAIATGLPMLAALSVTHGFLPPHPSPVALIEKFHADTGITLLYGIVVSIPAIIIAGPLFASFLKNIPSQPLALFKPHDVEEKKLPGTFNSFITALLPVCLIILFTVLKYIFTEPGSMKDIITFIGEPSVIMLISLLIALFSLGVFNGRSVKNVMDIFTDSVKDVGMLLLIIAGAGALTQILSDSGVSGKIADILKTMSVSPLILGWLMAAIIRVCIGSATIAGVTTAGIVAPLLAQSGINPNLMVLSVGAGSLMFSHVNDSGFWLFKEYFNLSIGKTLRTWSLMESIVSVAGLIAVLILNNFV